MLIKIANKEYSAEDLAVLAKYNLLNVGQKNDPASTTLTVPALQGPFQGDATQFGIFSAPGVRPQRFSALQYPRSFLSLVKMAPSEYTADLLEIVTGQTAGSGNNATSFCTTAPLAGQLKTCQQIFKWGDFSMQTRLGSLMQTGQLRNRAEIPGDILNTGANENPFIPEIMFNIRDTRSQLALEMYNLGIEIGRQMELLAIRGVYTGNNSNVYRGFFTEFTGLDAQIKTGYTDLGSPGAPLCPAVDSAVISFNAAVNGTIGGGDGRNIVQAAHDLYYGLNDRAVAVGMSDTQFAFIMRKEQFRAIVEQWACQYATYRCVSTNAGQPLTNDVTNTNALRLELMRGQYLLIDGIQVPVVFTEGISNPAIANATYEADMYLVAVYWAGMPLLRMEYFNAANQWSREFGSYTDPQNTQVINNGMYLVGKHNTGTCMEYVVQARFRMIVETPFLCGRIDNVNYNYRAPSREAIPGTSLYDDGGSTYRGVYGTT